MTHWQTQLFSHKFLYDLNIDYVQNMKRCGLQVSHQARVESNERHGPSRSAKLVAMPLITIKLGEGLPVKQIRTKNRTTPKQITIAHCLDVNQFDTLEFFLVGMTVYSVINAVVRQANCPNCVN